MAVTTRTVHREHRFGCEIASRGKKGTRLFTDQSGLKSGYRLLANDEEQTDRRREDVSIGQSMLREFMASFVNTFEKYFTNGTITTATMGRANRELVPVPERSFQAREFQVNDKYALSVARVRQREKL